MKPNKAKAFFLQLGDALKNCGLPPYVVVNRQNRVQQFYRLQEALNATTAPQPPENLKHLAIQSVWPFKPKLVLAYRVDTKGRVRYPLAILRRLGRTKR